MNAVETANGRKRLLQEIINYLDHIVPLLSIREQPFLPVPFPEDPTRLPTDFPHGDCCHKFTVEWDEEEHHIYEIQLRHFRPNPGDQHVTWEIRFKDEPEDRIGLLLVDRVVYEDRGFYQITGPEVLLFLGMAVGITKPLHIHKITLASANAPFTLLEIIEMDCNGSPFEHARGLPIELARREI